MIIIRLLGSMHIQEGSDPLVGERRLDYPPGNIAIANRLGCSSAMYGCSHSMKPQVEAMTIATMFFLGVVVQIN